MMNELELFNNMQVMNLFRTAWQYFIQNFLKILSIVLIIAVPVEGLIYYFFQDTMEGKVYGLQILLNLIMSALLTIIPSTIICMMFPKIVNGEEVGLREAFRKGLKYWFKLTIYVFVVRIISALGLLLFIIPGLIFVVRMLFVDYIIMLEGTYGNNPIKRSNEMIKGRTGEFMLIMVGVGIVQWGLDYVFRTYIHLDPWLLSLISGVISELFIEFMTVLFLIAYLYIRKYENPEQIITLDE
ncbi:hypothetical protein [Paenibacillus terrigena]|uniref:hypothetical protein n=1 Tax=Paenibacillus terrigena TaxID=369333 RepID=UPI00039E29C9|nr:hypothetical protein [Paenibacillus terrigena]